MLLVPADFARMVLENFVAETVGVGVEIDFCGADLFVTQHSLDGTEVGTTF